MSAPAPTRTSRSGRRELGIAVVLCLTGATLGLVAVGQPWAEVTVRQPPPLSVVRLALSGRVLAPLAGAAALVGLAGVLAVAAARGWGRVLVGVLLVLAGVGVASALPAAGTARVRALAALAERVPNAAAPGSVTTVDATAWPAVAAVGGLLITAAGALTAARGRRWPAMGARYDAPARMAPGAPSGPAPAQSQSAQWDALDRGEDPTA